MSESKLSEQIMRRAVALLAARERSRKGLEERLRQIFPLPENREEIKKVLDRLEQLNLLSDERFAEAAARDKSTRFGNRRIAWELRQQGVDQEKIDLALEALEQSEFDRAKEIWERRFGQLPENHKERTKQVRFLAARGFSFDVISQILDSDSQW